MQFLALTTLSVALGLIWGAKDCRDEQRLARNYNAMHFQEGYLSREWEIDLDAQLEGGR